jgi:hypothetical protein
VEVIIASYGIIMSCETFSMRCGVGIPLRTALWVALEAPQLMKQSMKGKYDRKNACLNNAQRVNPEVLEAHLACGNNSISKVCCEVL